MNRLRTVALALGLGLGVSACGKQADRPAQDTAGMKGMEGMQRMPGMGSVEGMQRDTADSAATGAAVPLDRTAAGRLGITFARAAVRPLGRELHGKTLGIEILDASQVLGGREMKVELAVSQGKG